jgi:hypothetical protein
LVGAEFRDVYCGNDYLFLEVELKDEAHNIVKRFSTGKRPTRVPKLCTWGNKSIEKIFKTIDIPAGKTVRYITYRDGGKDRERWAGRYGVVKQCCVLHLSTQLLEIDSHYHNTHL